VRRAPLIACAIAVTCIFWLAGPASAHVEVQPAEAAAGQPGTFAFRMPNEETAANTTALTVRFPFDHPVANVAAPPMDGWTIKVINRTLAAPLTVDGTAVTEVVDTVTWTGSLPPGRAEYFTLTTGPLPTDVGELVFDATQTYDNGIIVQWNQRETPGGAEPVHPAPMLRITGGVVPPPTTAADADGSTHDHGTETAGAATGSGSSDGLSGGVVLAGAAAAVVVIAGVTTVLYRRVSRPSPASRGGRRGAG
jgi:uncharacterized protein YcnI